tara:strand:+ start:69 stop:1082 length:1014 start_codon:yes stop_codon:yes gene_type:complete
LNNIKSKLDRSVLVIGGAGYIGSHIVLDLCDKGYDVTVLDNLSSGSEINIDRRVDFIKGDILNTCDLRKVFKKKYSSVFHFAALKAAGDSMKNPSIYSKVNIAGTINILNQMVESEIKNIIFSSTAAVYGTPEYLPLDESHPLKPVNFYGFTKLEIERLLAWYSSLKGFKFAALRYFNAAGYDLNGRIIGLEKKPANLLPIIMETALGLRKNMSVYGNDYSTFDGTCIRDYIHVSDLSSAHLASLEYLLKEKTNLYLNLATGFGSSVLQIIETTKKITDKDIPYRITSRREGDPPELVSMSKKSNKLINWRPKYSEIDIIIKSMWNIYYNYSETKLK